MSKNEAIPKVLKRLLVFSGFILATLILNAFTPDGNAFGWSKGHNVQTSLVFDHLPEHLRSCFSEEAKKKIITHYSHYPDSFTPFGPEVPDNIKTMLEQAGIPHRYALHGSAGQAASMWALVTLFKEKDYNAAALWVGALSHAIGDAGAINHHPLMHFYMHGYQSTRLVFSPGESLKANGWGNLSRTFASPEGRKLMDTILKDYTPNLLAEPGENMGRRALLRVMDLELIASANMARNTGLISTGWNAQITAKTEQEKAQANRRAMEGFASLCCIPVKLIADTIHTAHFMAENNIPLTHEDYKWARQQHPSRHAQVLSNIPLEQESIFEGLLHTQKTADTKVMVLIEPTYTMNKGQLGFQAKYHAAAMMKIMKDAHIPYITLDARKADITGLPSPSEVPVLVITSTGNAGSYACFSGPDLNKAITQYASEGGRILHIGQNVLTGMKPFKMAKKALTRKGFPIANEDIPQSHLTIHKILGIATNDTKRTFAESFLKYAGWQWPHIDTALTPGAPNLVPFVTMHSPNEEFIIGAFSLNEKHKITGAFLPQLAVFPYMFEDHTVTDVHMAHYDPTGTAIALGTLRKILAGTFEAPTPAPTTKKGTQIPPR